MQRETELSLLRRCMDLADSGAAFSPAEETTAPVQRYFDQSTFAREIDAIFKRWPHLVAHTSQLQEPGAFVTAELNGAPILVVRGVDDALSAFLNVCRHRGTQVETRACGRAKRFVCPYHAWSYDLSGKLMGAPHRQGFPSLAADPPALTPLPLYERAGLIFVGETEGSTGHDDPLPMVLLQELTAFGCDKLRVFRSDSRVWRANWKLIMEGGLESYHFRIAHKATIGSLFLDNVSIYELIGPHARSVLPRTTMLELKEVSEDRWNLREHANILYSIFPTASLLVQSDHIVMLRALPCAVDETFIEITTLVPTEEAGGPKGDGYWAANHGLTCKALSEDFALAESIQLGLKSGANEFVRFGRFESALGEMRTFIDNACLLADA